MKRYVGFPALAALGLLWSCAHHGGAIPAAPTLSEEMRSPATIVRHGNFTEYTLPAGVFPSDLTRGPYSTLWFASASGNSGGPAQIVELLTATGATHTFTAGNDTSGNPLVGNGAPIISVGGGIFFTGDAPNEMDEKWAIRVSPQGAFTYKDLGAADTIITNFTLGADGNLWYSFCPFSCISGGFVGAISTSGFMASALRPSTLDPRLDDGFCPRWVQSGPLNDLYTTADDCDAAPPAGVSRVYVSTTAGAIVQRFALPTGSKPRQLVTGSDRNLWILETGINKIARMTPGGVVTQFAMRTANAGLSGITPGTDGALWFTEHNANKIGRITTTGIINEFVIPTANSGPNGLTTCATACPPHGGVWFTETTANKIGRFVSPL